MATQSENPAATVMRGLADVEVASVMVLGDSHGTTGMVTGALDQAAGWCAALVSVGDFGVWPGDRGRWFLEEVSEAAAGVGIPIIVVPGNHDDYDQIDAAPTTGDGWIVLSDWVLAAPRGHIWHVAGRPWMAFGGAASIDGPGGAWPQVRGPWLEGDLIWEFDHFGQPRQRRATHDADLGGWWARERITDADVDRAVTAAEALGHRVDVLITHDVPAGIDLTDWKDGLHWETGERQRQRIQQVVNAAEPDITVSGHWHRPGYFGEPPDGPLQIILAADVSPRGQQRVAISCGFGGSLPEGFGRVT